LPRFLSDGRAKKCGRGEDDMQTFISFGNWTELGVREIKNSTQRLDSSKAFAKQIGGEILHFYLTMGEFDMVIVAEFPDDSSAALFLLHITKSGAVRFKTHKAFPEPEYRELMRGLG
jgi:uncharacterized protein with GYD domain